MELDLLQMGRELKDEGRWSGKKEMESEKMCYAHVSVFQEECDHYVQSICTYNFPLKNIEHILTSHHLVLFSCNLFTVYLLLEVHKIFQDSYSHIKDCCSLGNLHSQGTLQRFSEQNQRNRACVEDWAETDLPTPHCTLVFLVLHPLPSSRGFAPGQMFSLLQPIHCKWVSASEAVSSLPPPL